MLCNLDIRILCKIRKLRGTGLPAFFYNFAGYYVMGKAEEKYNQRRLKTSYITTIVSISLVLFMLGLLGILLYHTQKIGNYVKENIGFTVILKEGVSDSIGQKVMAGITKSPFTKEARYITKEEAAITLQKELGEDFVGFLGYNPLLPSIELKLNADFANADSLQLIEKKILATPGVKEVSYQRSLVDVVNANLRKVGLVILGFSILLLIIAIALINNTIRLAIFSKRFLIKTMQLVGATESFIRKPFIISGIISGLYGALIALALLVITLITAGNQLPELVAIQDMQLYAGLFLFVTLLGIIISWISTFFAVKKYLRLKADYLY
jgi:cell division transport system permease protein